MARIWNKQKEKILEELVFKGLNNKEISMELEIEMAQIRRKRKELQLRDEDIKKGNEACFAYVDETKDEGCDALKIRNCINCNFFKTKKEHEEQVARIIRYERLKPSNGKEIFN